jgi:hypothetical protein
VPRDSNDIILDYFGLPPGRFTLQFRNIRAKDLLSNFNILGSKIAVPDSSNTEDMLEIFNSRGTHQVIDSSGKLGMLILMFCITQTILLDSRDKEVGCILMHSLLFLQMGLVSSNIWCLGFKSI